MRSKIPASAYRLPDRPGPEEDNLRPPAHRCILLFARTAKEEACAKRLSRARGIFAFARRRIAAAAASLPGVDLLVVGRGGALAQRGNGFAERLANAFADACALGYRSILAVPTDVPRLGRRELAEALRRLEGATVVLGPSPDGGAYLIGCRTDPAALFAGVRWQTSRTLADLAANAGDPALLDPLEDVDHWADIAALGARPRLDPALSALVASVLRRSLPSPWDEPSHRITFSFLLPLANRPPPPLVLPSL